MSGWRSAELELIFGGPLDAEHLTAAAIQRLIDDAVSESDQLEFKRDAYPSVKTPGGAPPPWTSAHEFAKDVAAFANERGGLLILGLEDDKGVAKSRVPLTGDFEQDHQRLHQALLNYQSPLADCTILKVEGATAGEYFVAVVVPPSRRAPHAVVGRKGSGRIPLHYPVRRGQDNPCLTEHEVAERYRRRLSWQEDEERRVRRVVNEGRSALRRGAGSWLFVAVIPESPADGVLDRSTAKEVEDWYRSGRGRSPLRGVFPAHGRPIPAPGRITFTGSVRTDADDETTVRDGYAALYVDGTVFAATPLKGRQADEEFGSVQDLDLVDDAIALADLALDWCPRRAGSYGTATAVIGFADGGSPDLTGSIEGRPVVLFNSATVSPGWIPGTRPVPVTADAKTVVDLASVGGNQDRMIVTYWLLCGILQWFGIPEPRQVTPTGAFVLPAFSHSMRRQVEAWAQRFGVQVLHRFET